jgi:hypothetical protein
MSLAGALIQSDLMGTFFHPLTIIGPKRDETLQALVDTDHLFAVLPYGLLERLDCWPNRSHRYKGTERGFGHVRARLNGEEGWVTYISAADDEPALIGSHTLNSFVLQVNDEGTALEPKVFREVRHF